MNTYKNETLRLLLFAALLGQMTIASCKKKPTEPVEQPRNPRAYVWSIDTLSFQNSFQTYMYQIWGSNSNKLYTAGHNGHGGGKMYQYDGQNWEDVKLSTAQGGNIIGAIDLRDIIGFSPNDIWAVGERLNFNPNPPPNFLDSSLVIRYNGSGWFEVKDAALLKGGALLAVWGNSSSNLWAGGRNVTLFHYDGLSWQKLLLPITQEPNSEVMVRSIAGTPTGDRVYILIRGFDYNTIPQSEYHYFVQYANNAFTIVDIDSVVGGPYDVDWGHQALWYSPWDKLYSVGEATLFEWTGERWKFIMRYNAELENVFGASADNFYVVGQYGQVWHYNGKDWHQFTQFEAPDVPTYTGIWTDGKEVFIVGHNTHDTLILHGK
ncbi:hypothetical protein EDS67_02430 [candidate division KSB1 bacterium]|nr:MAG: hypothetical protein EDS67_02430 [candidate division KSB1 bacterium]MBC6950767.1 hypothetical protein [candidate division KSB1 bacterium]MCE7941887.1 hypothetical protein [Chlorobi bacterium CHB1]NUM76133.1 hypothetical protein [candidate division KSB1 bacterium]